MDIMDTKNSKSRKSVKTSVICVYGLQRSGNHAVIDWMASLLIDTIYFGDQDHTIFFDLKKLDEILITSDKNNFIFSFEDSIKHSPEPSSPLLSTVANFPAEEYPNTSIRDIHILRDPYNLWASRLAGHARTAHGGVGLTSDPSWEAFRRNWICFTDQFAKDPTSFILFNRWRKDREYRKKICASLGGKYSETTMNTVSRQGGGSSFQGNTRSSYYQVFSQPRKFFRPRLLKKIFSHPKTHAKKWFTPQINANQLAIEDRWRLLLDNPNGRLILEDEEIRARSLDIFKMGISKTGELLSREG